MEHRSTFETNVSSMDTGDDDEIPLQHRRPFGAGIKRKRIDFVPQSVASTPEVGVRTQAPSSAYDAYTSIVFPHANKAATAPNESSGDVPAAPGQGPVVMCDICNLPKATDAEQRQLPHESSLVHQVCLTHSHPPSALDRTRKGLTYLEAYGWDPDARTGLGASGEGRLYPVQAQQKQDNSGIGAPSLSKDALLKKQAQLNGKALKEAQNDAKQREAKLKDLIYGKDDVNKYLGIEL